jgi:hypothetical protein
MLIQRHAIPDLKVVRERFDYSCERLGKVLGYCQNRVASLNAAIEAAWDIILRGSVVQPDSPEIRRAIRLGAQAGAAFFRIRAAGDAPIQYQLGDGPPMTSKGAVHESNAHSGTWLQSFYLAALARDAEALAVVCATPTALLRQSSTKGPEFHDLFVDAAQAVWTGAGDAGARIAATLAAINPTRADIRTPAWDKHWWVPQLELLDCIRNRFEHFVATLERALLLHQAYFSETEERRKEKWGFLAVGPMVLAALARDHGVSIQVESDYFLEWDAN